MHEDIKYSKVSIAMTLCLFLACIILVVFLLLLINDKNSNEYTLKEQEIISNLINDLLNYNAVDNYFEEEIINYSISQLDYVFFYDNKNPNGFIINYCDRGLTEITLLSNTDYLYPRVLFLYELNEELDKFVEFKAYREQPFSRLNEEYNALWE